MGASGGSLFGASRLRDLITRPPMQTPMPIETPPIQGPIGKILTPSESLPKGNPIDTVGLPGGNNGGIIGGLIGDNGGGSTQLPGGGGVLPPFRREPQFPQPVSPMPRSEVATPRRGLGGGQGASFLTNMLGNGTTPENPMSTAEVRRPARPNKQQAGRINAEVPIRPIQMF